MHERPFVDALIRTGSGQGVPPCAHRFRNLSHSPTASDRILSDITEFSDLKPESDATASPAIAKFPQNHS